MAEYKAYLVLQNGTVLSGEAFGACCDSVGELVFTTGMCGYIETLTDPSYYGQTVIQTYPLIGNYGIIPDDFEGEPALSGYIVREYCDEPSNFRSEKTLDAFLREKGIPGICGVDTRELTRTLRSGGVMNAAICHQLPFDIGRLKSYKITDAVPAVSCRETSFYPAEGKAEHKVTLIDYGEKRNIIRMLNILGCDVRVVPYNTTAEEILADKPDGVMLSNGPGDPAENVQCIKELKTMLGKLPMFGICLGHQLLALAAGGKTEKMKYGHRGTNQPVRDLFGTRTYITSQNHGYAVVAESVRCGKERFVNANDRSCEGMVYPGLNAFSVQFHPEACAGPHDTSFLFDEFCSMMGGAADAER